MYQKDAPTGGVAPSIVVGLVIPEARQISEAPLPTGSSLVRPRAAS